jgi:hypothetical protein
MRERYFHWLIAVALSVVLPGLTGCFQKNYPEEKEKWGPRQWKEVQYGNQQRLLPEEQRKREIGLNLLSSAGQSLGNGIMHLWNWATGNTAFNAAKNLLDPSAPDRRRQAVVYLSKREYGRRDPYTKYYAEMARTDPDYTVRAMAIRALNRARDKSTTEVFIKALDDQHALVRLEAAKALANLPDEAAIPALVRHLEGRVEIRVRERTEVQDETVDVRVACADALRNFRTVPAAQALVRVLRDKEFGVSWQSRQSLKLMTGRDYRYDPAAWLSHLSGAPKPFG